MTPREKMVWEIKKVYGLDAPLVFFAMLKVPREDFVSKRFKNIAYDDRPVPIGYAQTMSQPYTVAFMTNLLISDKRKAISEKIKEWKVVEIGTGSGYQAAVLSKLVKEVYTIEIIRQLAGKAKKTLKKLGYKNVYLKTGSGEYGWPEKAPFDAVMVTAGIKNKVPKSLFKQLKEGGILVAPVGMGPDKVMTKFVKKKGGRFDKEEHGIFNFVPFVES